MTALTMFTDYVGTNNFAKSKVLQEMNKGNYKDMIRLMLAHSGVKALVK